MHPQYQLASSKRLDLNLFSKQFEYGDHHMVSHIPLKYAGYQKHVASV